MRLGLTMTISSLFLVLAVFSAFLAAFTIPAPRRISWIGLSLLFFFLWRAFGGGNIITVYRG